jgi:hypothetical protein
VFFFNAKKKKCNFFHCKKKIKKFIQVFNKINLKLYMLINNKKYIYSNKKLNWQAHIKILFLEKKYRIFILVLD